MKRAPVVGPLLIGWWVNRRYTRNVSSIVLAGALSISAYVFLFQRSFLLHDPDYAFYGVFVHVVLIVNVIFFPAAREVYYRLMRPVHEGVSGFWVGGILLVIVLAVRFVLLVALWLFAIPLGALAGMYLSAGEAWGSAWRLSQVRHILMGTGSNRYGKTKGQALFASKPKGERVTVRVRPYALLAPVVFVGGFVLSAVVLISLSKVMETPQQMRDMLALTVIIGIGATGLGALIQAATHGAPGSHVEGVGKLVGVLGWSVSVFAAFFFAGEETELPEGVVIAWLVIGISAVGCIAFFAAMAPAMKAQFTRPKAVLKRGMAGRRFRRRGPESSASLARQTRARRGRAAARFHRV